MVAPFFELHRGLTIEASLPALLLGHRGKMLSGFIVGALFAGVPFAIAETADFRLATFAPSEFSRFQWPSRCVERRCAKV